MRGQQRHRTRIESAEADLGGRILVHVIDVLRMNARFDHELLVLRHDVQNRLARTDHFADRRHAHGHDFAIHRRAHHLAFDLVLRRAQPLAQLAHLGGSFLELVGCLLLVLVARLRDARFELADALARQSPARCGIRRRAAT